MSGSKWKQSKIIDEKDLANVSDYAKFMFNNIGYYFKDKKTGKEIAKWEIYITFSKNELEDVYNGTQGRYERKKK